MNKRILIYLNCLLLQLFILPTVCANRSPISVRADIWYPFTGSEYSEKPGYMIEVLAKILEQSDYRLDYATISWRRAVDLSRRGYYDCIAGADEGDAPDFIFTENTFGMIVVKFFVRKGFSWSYKDVNSLKTVRLGVTRDYSYDNGPMDKYIQQDPDKNITVISKENSLDVLIDLLRTGEIDVFADADLVVYRTLQEKQLSNEFRVAGDLGKASPIYIACGPTNPNSRTFIKLFDKGLEKLRFSGDLQKILDRYQLSDWEKTN